MKKIIVCLCVLALVFASCASSQAGVSEKADGSASTVGAAQAGQTQAGQAAAESVETKVNVLFSDGTLDEYTVSEYDDSLTHLKTRKRFSASETLLEQTEFAYEGDRLTTKTTNDAEGRLKNQVAFQYNAQGLVSKETLMNKSGKAVSSSEYFYDTKGNRIRTVVTSGANVKMAEIVYTLDNKGLVTLSENRNGAGQMVNSIQNRYEGNNLINQTILNSNGQVNARTSYVWRNNREISSEQAGVDGSVRLRTTNEYGDSGELLKKTIENLQGNSVQILEYEYAFKPARR